MNSRSGLDPYLSSRSKSPFHCLVEMLLLIWGNLVILPASAKMRLG